MEIRIINKSNNPLPTYETPHAAGMDLRAFLDEPVSLQPMERILVPTGLYIALPEGTEAQIRPRSGLAYKQGITVLNSPGTIDSDYRGEVKVLLINLSDQIVHVNSGDRIAQMVVAPYVKTRFAEVGAIGETQRGEGGFGSTGTK